MALFEYFPNYIWNLSVAIAMESGGRIGEIVDMCKPIRDAAESGAGSGLLASRIAPRRRLRVGVTDPVAGSKSPSCRVSIRSPKRSITACSSMAAADRMRAPDAWPVRDVPGNGAKFLLLFDAHVSGL